MPRKTKPEAATGQLRLSAPHQGRRRQLRAAGPIDLAAIAVGADHTLALKSDGTVWGFGNNESGQLDPTSFSASS
jgi:alpha-tubulin suppressor-like RCC1 family protein